MSYADCNDLGGMAAYNWEMDPKRVAFQAARYLAVAKILEGKFRVLEVGCADGWGTRIVRQHVPEVHGMDVDPDAIAIARLIGSKRWPVEFFVGDVLSFAATCYDAVYCLDVFEHFPEEANLLGHLSMLAPMAVIGTPSLESQAHASEISRREHVNCVTAAGLGERMRRWWRHVLVLGMNDTTVHLGHDAMRHYLIGIGCD